MEWNRAVDRAVVSGVSETEVVELKKTEITDRVKKSVEQNGSKPERCIRQDRRIRGRYKRYKRLP